MLGAGAMEAGAASSGETRESVVLEHHTYVLRHTTYVLLYLLFDDVMLFVLLCGLCLLSDSNEDATRCH